MSKSQAADNAEPPPQILRSSVVCQITTTIGSKKKVFKNSEVLWLKNKPLGLFKRRLSLESESSRGRLALQKLNLGS